SRRVGAAAAQPRAAGHVLGRREPTLYGQPARGGKGMRRAEHQVVTLWPQVLRAHHIQRERVSARLECDDILERHWNKGQTHVVVTVRTAFQYSDMYIDFGRSEPPECALSFQP